MNADEAHRTALEGVVAELQEAWNAGDAAQFARVFSGDAEQVNIFGTRLCGRREIEARHAHIFATIFRNSTNDMRILDVRVLTEDIMLARISSAVTVPDGPLAGRLETIASVLVQRGCDRWQITLFHNTAVKSRE